MAKRTGSGKAETLAEFAARSTMRSAARKDPKLHSQGAPLGYHLRGASTLLDAEGNTVQQWVKTAKDGLDPLALLELFKEVVAEDPPKARAKVKPTPQAHSKELLTVYPMGDPHLGMYSWAPETGANFDIKIAEHNLCEAMDKLVGLAPPSETALIAELGDFFHSDNASNRTSRSGAALDVDGRWAKILKVGIRAMVRCIDLALAKHKTVRVVCEIGNHDDHTAIMLALALDAYYRDEPRCQVDTSPSPYHWLEFGKCLIGITHGHNTKAQNLPGIMAHDRREAWGRTLHRHFYCGHVHHESLKEYPGCTVETVRTLAAGDAWHHASGYRSGRSAFCDVWHKDRGQILRHTVGIEQVEAKP
jgi:hypothetical protein